MRSGNNRSEKGRKDGYSSTERRKSDKPGTGGKRPGRRPSEPFADERRTPSDSERPKSYRDKPPGRYGADRKSSFRDDRKPAGRRESDFKGDERASNDKAPFERRSGERPFVKGSGSRYKPSERSDERRNSTTGDRKSSPYTRAKPRTTGRSYGSGKPTGEGEEKKWNRKESHEFYGERKRSATPQRSDFRSRKPAGENERSSTNLPTVGSGSTLTRLNKYISNAGICSRREADELIGAGVISVNDEIITELGYKVKRGDIVKYNNSRLKSEKTVYLLLNKPKDYITTVEDPRDRKTVMSLIRSACKERVYPVGRLDRNTTGLLLFTNDGQLADKLTHPSFEVQKIYEVHLDKNLKPDHLEQIRQGIQLEDGFIQPDDISFSPLSKSIVGIELHSGRNRIVRRIFESLDYNVIKLDRVIYAGLTKKDLPRGRWRFITDLELAQLKMIAGSKNFKGGRRDKIYKRGE